MTESKGINWSHRLAELIQESSEIPTDVSFKIEEDKTKEDKVKAHRLVLGMVSQPFRKMLFVTSTNDKDAKEILVKETTVAAFRTMVDAVYNTKTIQESLEDKTVHEMFAVLNLAKKYEIPELVLPTRDCLANFPLSGEAVLEVASAAMEYLNTFDEEAEELLLHCAKFLEPKFEDAKSVFKFTAANEEHGDTILKLFSLMDKMKPKQCDNCSQVPCKDGQGVNDEEFRLGLKVACNNSSRNWADGYIGNRGTVEDIMGRYVTLKDFQTEGGRLDLGAGTEYYVKNLSTNSLSFHFYCKTA